MPLARINDFDLNYCIDDYTDAWCDKRRLGTILMHHAFFRGLESLAGWVPTLARHYRVVRFDSCGFGGSSAPPEPFELTLDQLASDALALMDHLEVERCHFVGVSSGGIAGQLLAVSHPHRIRSLSLCDSPHRLNDAVQKQLAAGEASPSAAIRKYGVRGWRDRTMASTLDPRLVDRRMMEWQLEMQVRVPLHICASMEQSLETSDTAPLLKDIACPTLVMAGDRSVFTPPEMAVFMARRIPHARLQIFPNVGSTLSVMHPQACAQAVLDFATELDRTASMDA